MSINNCIPEELYTISFPMANPKFEPTSISLQELIKEPLLSIPDTYIQINQESPVLSRTTSMPAVPIIDIESLSPGDTRAFELEKLHSTCKDWGVFQVINHGIAPSVVEKLKHEVQEFYKLPLDEKMRYKLRPGEVEGFGQTVVGQQDEKIDWADRFLMVVNPIHRRKPHLLPELPSSLREAMEAYFKEAQKLAMVLLKLMGEALKIEQRETKDIFEDGLQIVRMTYYPPCLLPELVVGIRPHTDASGLTILLQVNEVDGLEVKKDGVWIPVNVVPGSFVVNLGDTMEIFSNGMYKSVEHKVTVNSVKERITLGMFFNPKLERQVGPANCLINHNKHPPLYKTVSMEKYVKDFFSRKLRNKTMVDDLKVEVEVGQAKTG